MLEIDIKDINNNIKGKVALSEKIFNNNASDSIVHSAVVAYLANQRQGTHCTKNRGEVSGGGKKPWRQKKTGRARHGSIRSPIWRGGGIVFGPKPRDYSIELPHQMKKIALYKALTMKFSDGEICVIDKLDMDRPNTKEMINIIKNIGLQDKKVLFVVPKKDMDVIQSIRNIPTMDVIRVSDLNALHVALYNYIIFTVDALTMLQGSAEVRG